jgi:hypothetical protein
VKGWPLGRFVPALCLFAALGCSPQPPVETFASLAEDASASVGIDASGTVDVATGVDAGAPAPEDIVVGGADIAGGGGTDTAAAADTTAHDAEPLDVDADDDGEGDEDAGTTPDGDDDDASDAATEDDGGSSALADVDLPPSDPDADDGDAEDTNDATDPADTGDGGGDAGPGIAYGGIPSQLPVKLDACDAGDEAWVTRALGFLAGRRPHGYAEVEVLAQMVKASGRETVAMAMLTELHAQVRWVAWLTDELGVERIGMRLNGVCTMTQTLPTVDGALAKWLVTHEPAKDAYGTAFTFADVLRSAIAGDEILAAYESWLFVRLTRPYSICDNPSVTESEHSIRRYFRERFQQVYLHRNIACVGCHNGSYSVTDDPEAAKDRYWPVQGRYEKAIFGSDGNASEETIDGAHRYHGFAAGGICVQPQYCSVAKGKTVSPWGIHPNCSVVSAPDQVENDVLGNNTFWTQALGATASSWQLWASLRKGSDALRSKGKPKVDPVTLELDGDEAFAYLLALRIAHQVWYEAFGRPLTMAHMSPRSPAQRDTLEALADTFVASKFSLRTLAANVALHPLFNQLPPSSGCLPPGTKSVYNLPGIFEPLTADAPDPAVRPNSYGDGVNRVSSRQLASMTHEVLGWLPQPAKPSRPEQREQVSLGMRLGDDEPGFRGTGVVSLAAYEYRYGTCEPQKPQAPQQASNSKNVSSMTCAGRCNANDAGATLCWCDASCMQFGDCCPDFQSECSGFVKANPQADAPTDWLETLLTNAPPQTPVGTLVATLKDRLLADGSLTPAEASLVAAVLGVQNLDAPWSGSPTVALGLRRYCGVLLRSPQFTFAGAPTAGDASKAAPLEVGGETRQTLCADWLTMLPGLAKTHACGSSGLIAVNVP